MTTEQAALIAAAILVNSWGSENTTGQVLKVASEFTSWLERSL